MGDRPMSETVEEETRWVLGPEVVAPDGEETIVYLTPATVLRSASCRHEIAVVRRQQGSMLPSGSLCRKCSSSGLPAAGRAR